MQIDCQKVRNDYLYKVLISAIIPRPIAWVSTCSLSGVDNLAPFSFFNLFSIDPPILGFAPGLKMNLEKDCLELKDTLRNIIDTKEFVVNIVTQNNVEIMNESSAELPSEISEFDIIGATRLKCHALEKTSRVAESPINMECVLHKLVELGSNTLVLGKIIHIHIDDKIVKDDRIIPELLKPVSRLGDISYSSLSDIFQIKRPN